MKKDLNLNSKLLFLTDKERSDFFILMNKYGENVAFQIVIEGCYGNPYLR